MPESSKPTETGSRGHTIKWDRADLARIEEAARVLSEREHLDLNATDIIRSGARRFAEEILNGTTSPAAA
jgi:hypothetical protein